MNVFKTKHAMVIRGTDGMELLIHVAINTVKLRGQFFEAHVQAGDPIQAGDKLLTFDLAQLHRKIFQPLWSLPIRLIISRFCRLSWAK